MKSKEMFRVYMCGKLTGRTKDDILKEHEPIREAIVKRGGAYEDPFEKEESLFKKRQKCGFEGINQSISEVVHLDKTMIKRSDILLYMTGDIPSTGSLLEVGYARYLHIKPIIVISPKHHSREMLSWLTVEADYIAKDYEDALDTLVDKWGTPERRLKWRCELLAKHGRSAEVGQMIRDYIKSKGGEL